MTSQVNQIDNFALASWAVGVAMTVVTKSSKCGATDAEHLEDAMVCKLTAVMAASRYRLKPCMPFATWGVLLAQNQCTSSWLLANAAVLPALGETLLLPSCQIVAL